MLKTAEKKSDGSELITSADKMFTFITTRLSATDYNIRTIDLFAIAIEKPVRLKRSLKYYACTASGFSDGQLDKSVAGRYLAHFTTDEIASILCHDDNQIFGEGDLNTYF